MEERVVQLYQEGAVGIVVMEEREARNTFTKKFIQNLKDAFAHIDKSEDIKVVVVHGFDNYFCCGGTQQELLDILDGSIQFTDLQISELFLRCKVPVIAAMQGHALGGGLVLGSYADILVLGEECIYSTNFMKYGFTPGMGGTYIIPKKFGESLGNEMLLTAKSYRGKELKERGVPFQVVSKDQVIEEALKNAHELADKPRLSLIVLKEHLSRTIRKELPQVVEEELSMHETTFAQPGIRERITKMFGQ